MKAQGEVERMRLRMKKFLRFLTILGIAACLFGVSACNSGKSDAGLPLPIEEGRLTDYVDQMVDGIRSVVEQGQIEQYASNSVIYNGLTAWESCLDDLGEYAGLTDYDLSYDGEEISAQATVDGTENDLLLTLTLAGDGTLTGISVSPVRSLGDLMLDALLNTILGMGTVFLVLILIYGLISSFKFINLFQEKRKKGSGAGAGTSRGRVSAAPAPGPVPGTAPAAQEPAFPGEELSEDGELVAVIAAAIAASEGSADPNAYIVRSIRRRPSAWKRK